MHAEERREEVLIDVVGARVVERRLLVVHVLAPAREGDGRRRVDGDLVIAALVHEQVAVRVDRVLEDEPDAGVGCRLVAVADHEQGGDLDAL